MRSLPDHRHLSCDESTRERLERQFRLHVYPVFGDRPLSAVQPSTIRA
ncbi:hypothetical protein ACFYON_23180 [Micromonospora sp. NPDC005686]